MTNDQQPQAMHTKRPVGRPPKHGLYSKFALVPLTDSKNNEIMELLGGQRHLIAPSDQITVNLLARVLAQIELMGRWLSENGLFQDNASGASRGAATPILPQYLSAIKVASRLCDQLGLSPDARVRLSKGVAQTEDLASKIQRLRDE